MLTWLQQDLASTNQPWLIAFFHHPPYAKGSHDSDVDVGVDLVLTGHSHCYERSYLIDGH